MVRLSLLLSLLGCQEYGIVGKDADVSGLEDSAGPVAVEAQENRGIREKRKTRT